MSACSSTTTTSSSSGSLESLPTECFNAICLHLEVGRDMAANLSLASKTCAALCGRDNNALWNLLLCHRLWTVDPTDVLDISDSSTSTSSPMNADQIVWREQYRLMIAAEQEHQRYLDRLHATDLDGWLDRHFLGQLAPRWNGWERRFWSWSSQDNFFAAWFDDSQNHCLSTFRLKPTSTVRRVSAEEQIQLGVEADILNRNPVTPKPHVFTLTDTTFPMLWACESPEQLQLWMDKICVTLHRLQFHGRTYRAPAKYLLPTTKRS